MCDFVDDWTFINADLLVYFETDFFNDHDIQVLEFTRNDITYNNILHYLYNKGIRGGIFSEEPVGRKGVTNRWGDWKMKNTQNDFRGCHILLMSIPYSNKMVITTDRTDIWREIEHNE